MRVRVMTLNVWNREGDPRRLEVINRELHRLRPDLLALQEVVDGPGTRMVDELVEGLGLQTTHQADVQAYAPPFSDRYGGSAVATRWPHRFVEALDLRLADAAGVPWATLAVAVQLPDEGELLFIGATASWRRNEEAAREQQAVAITELDARHRRELPTVIAGDFNAGPDAASGRLIPRRMRGCKPLGSHSTRRLTASGQAIISAWSSTSMWAGMRDPHLVSLPRGALNRSRTGRGSCNDSR
jgi:endonuclease/exonuclease/phosphatase family metal-dependent hydrolase